MTEEKKLLQQIEIYREKMQKLCKDNPLFSEEVVLVSQTLDELLNKYNIILQQKIATY